MLCEKVKHSGLFLQMYGLEELGELFVNFHIYRGYLNILSPLCVPGYQ